jgi:hypothetical protein
MSNRAITWAYQQDLKGGPKFVLVTLADMADQEHSCFPGVPELARLTGFGRTAVMNHLDTLIDAGLISKERRARKDGSRSSNRYYLAVDGAFDTENQSPESGHSNREPKSGIRTPQSPDSGQPKSGIRTGILEPSLNPQNEPTEVNGDRDSEFELIALNDVTDNVNLAEIGFDDFWTRWPRHDGKKAALAAWAKAIKRAPAEVIVAAAAVYAESPWRPERQFVPHGATWLNGDRWDDPPPGPPEQRAAPPSPAHRPAVQAGLDLVAQFAQEEAHEPHRDRAALDRGIDPGRHQA